MKNLTFINYQGEDIAATLVNYLSGNIPTSTIDHDGDEELFRDEHGCYYLRRELDTLDSQEMRGPKRPASGRTLIHRINVNTAILWASTRLNSETLDLRRDAANLLMEGRGYSDPFPLHMNAVERKQAVVQADPQHRLTDEGAYRLTFETAPTERRCGDRRTVEVPADQLPEVDRLAAVFGLSRAEFVQAHSRGKLPGQPLRGYPGYVPMDKLFTAEHLSFSLLDDTLAKRIQRAAQVRELSLEEFVAEAVASAVDCYEQNIIVHPQTGELLCGDDSQLCECVNEEMTAAPIGQEDSPVWRLHTGRQQVQLNVWLTPEQMERVEFPHLVYNAATDTEVPCALIPLDPEGNVVLRVDGKEVKPDGPVAPPARQERGGVQRWRVPLSEEASLELRAFCLRHSLKPEYVLAEYCESFLNEDFLADRTNREGTIESARWRESQAQGGDAGGVEDESEEAGEDEEEAEIDHAVAHMQRVLGEPSPVQHPGGDDTKARFLRGELPVPGAA